MKITPVPEVTDTLAIPLGLVARLISRLNVNPVLGE
jgi:hypothetical protein